MKEPSRPEFLKAAAAGTVAASVAPHLRVIAEAHQRTSPPDGQNVRLAFIGAGGQGMSDTRTATPDHWHSKIAIDAMQAGKDVFVDAVRSRKPVVEDAVFGFRAAAPALLTNSSYFEERPIAWDPEGMRKHA